MANDGWLPVADSRPMRATVVLRILFVVCGLGLWFLTQWLIGIRPPMGDEGAVAGRVLSEHDAVFRWTAPVNQALHQHPTTANGLLMASSAVIDVLGIWLLLAAIFGPSLRPFIGLLMLFALRQVCQAVCALPAPDGIIWRSPGMPTLLVTYGVANDFFFSGHTGIAVLGATELCRLKNRWWMAMGVAIALFEGATVLVLRAHYTLDVFTGLVTALLVSLLAAQIAPRVDAMIERFQAGRAASFATPNA